MTNAQRQAAFTERRKQEGKHRVAYWLDTAQVDAIRRVLVHGDPYDRIRNLEREVASWKNEATLLRQVLRETSQR